MAGPGQEDHVQVILLDESVQMDVNKGQARTGSPVSQQATLNVFALQRLFQEGIVLKVDHAQHQVVTSAPVGVRLAQILSVQWRSRDCRSCGAIGGDRLAGLLSCGYRCHRECSFLTSVCASLGKCKAGVGCQNLQGTWATQIQMLKPHKRKK